MIAGALAVLDTNGTKFMMNTVIWDCGDYIHMINGTVPMNEIMSFINGMTEK